MRRLFWLGAGAAIGVLVVRRATRVAESFTPAGLGRSLTTSVVGLGDAVRDFAADVREGMAEREAQLLAALETDGQHGAPGP